MNRGIFREYDIRGLVGADLTEDVVRDIGRAVAAYMRERGRTKASVGRDCRLSSDDFARFITEGMVESGIAVTDLGVVPTPLFYFSLFTRDVEGGVMVTGSHNPPDYNGFKVAFGRTTLFGPEVQELADIVEGRRFVSGRGSVFPYHRINMDYFDFLRGNIAIGRPVKAAIDAGNGTGGAIALPIMEEMGMDIIPLNCEMDGRFPRHFPDPTVEANLSELTETVLARSCELGIAYDGDADRIGVVDDKGGIIRGDYLMIIFAREILKRHMGAAFVSEVKCSKNLFDDIAEKGGRPVMWKAGHSLIKQKMKETDALFGGEMSGHMFFADRFFGFDDAIYASLRLLEIVAADPRPLSELLSDLPRTFATPEIRMPCPEEAKFEVVRRITEYYRQRFEIVDTDGVRVILPDGWGLVRASNTQPILVLRFEAESSEGVERIEQMVRADLAKFM